MTNWMSHKIYAVNRRFANLVFRYYCYIKEENKEKNIYVFVREPH